MVYAGDLKSPGPSGHAGSSPASGTRKLPAPSYQSPAGSSPCQARRPTDSSIAEPALAQRGYSTDPPSTERLHRAQCGVGEPASGAGQPACRCPGSSALNGQGAVRY